MAGPARTRCGGSAATTFTWSTTRATKFTEAVNAGTDLVTTALSIVLGANVENAILTGGANINGFGNVLNNGLVGNSGMNVLNGGDGIDQLSGASGNDQLAGGLGNDVLIGGVGKDTFLFHTALNATSNVDTVTDFKVIDDTVRLENAVFTALTATGALNADAFHIGAAAADAEDRIIYNSATGALLYDANGVGGAAGSSSPSSRLGSRSPMAIFLWPEFARTIDHRWRVSAGGFHQLSARPSI